MTKQNQSSSNHVYIVDIAILTNIKAILCLHRLPYIMLTSLTYIVDIAINVVQHRDDIESTSYSFFLVYVHRQRIVDRYRVDIVSTSNPFFLFYIVNIVYIAILIDNESTLCLHRNFSFLFTSSTLQSKHVMDKGILLICNADA